MAELMAFSMAFNPSYTPLITALIGSNMKLNIFVKISLIKEIISLILSKTGSNILPGSSMKFISATRAPPSSMFFKKFNIMSRNPPSGLVAFSAFLTLSPTLDPLLSNAASLSFLSDLSSFDSACLAAFSLSSVCSLVLLSMSSKFSSIEAKLGASMFSAFFCSSFSDLRSSMTACFSSLSFLMSSRRSSNLLSKSSSFESNSSLKD